MRSNNVLGFIFAATLDDKIPELASSRTTASVPIGGKYRIIDFDLSNMSNSGISNVGIVAKSNFQSLMDHVGSGSAYDLSKRRSNLSILPPYDGKAFSSFVETIYNMHGYIEHCREEYVLISQGNVITNIDYTDVFDFHSKKKADITLIYKNHAIPQGYDRPITLDVDNDGKVNQIFVKPGVVDKGVFNHAYGSILIKKDLLMSEIRNAISVNQLDVRRLIQSSLGKYSIYAYENKGYCAAISSINDYNISISVQNHGECPSPDIADTILLPFCTDKQEHLGLGLAIASETADAMNGKLYWNHADGFTCFTITTGLTKI